MFGCPPCRTIMRACAIAFMPLPFGLRRTTGPGSMRDRAFYRQQPGCYRQRSISSLGRRRAQVEDVGADVINLRLGQPEVRHHVV